MSTNDSSKMPSAATHLEQGNISIPETRESVSTAASAMGEMPLQLTSPSFHSLLQADSLIGTSVVDSSDLVPTPSLWTQSLIADSSPSPISSPMRWFQQQSNLLTKPSSSSSPSSSYDTLAPVSSITESSHLGPASEPRGDPSLGHTAADLPDEVLEGLASSEEPLNFAQPKLTVKEEGKFVSLSASGIKVSILEKSLVGQLPSSRIVASGGDPGSLPPLNVQAAHIRRIVMPVPESARLSGMTAGPAQDESLVSPFLIEGCCQQDGEEEGQLPFQELEEGNDDDWIDSVPIESRADVRNLVRMHPEIVSALKAPPSQVTHATDSRSFDKGSARGMSDRHKIPFPTIAATRTRRVRTPRFFDV